MSKSSVASTTPNVAFRDAVNHGKAPTATITVHPLEEEDGIIYDSQQIVEKAHEERHKRRIRIARSLQHLLTSLLSLGVAVLQGKTFITYETTKNVVGAWPDFVNLLPTLMLFATACAALIIDICAITAYLWPQTRIGRKAFSFAMYTQSAFTTFKGVTYCFSAIVCRSSFVQGNASGMNNDLWSWSCSSKADAMAHVNQGPANCTGSLVAWILAISNIGIEVLGSIIDQIVSRDERRWKERSGSNKMKSIGSTANHASDTKPLLSDAASVGQVGKGTYQKLSDDDYDQLGKVTGNLNGQLKTSLPELQIQQ